MIVIAVLSVGCQDSPGASTPQGESSSGDGGTRTSGELPLPDRVPPEPFVLPEGCGDEVPVSGQYDCHYPVSLEYLKEAMGTRQAPLKFLAWDMDGDGRDELLVQAPGFDSFHYGLAPTRWNGESFDVGGVVGGQVNLLNWTTHIDLGDDGRRDLVKFANREMSYHWTTSSFELDAEHIPAYFDIPIWGHIGPIDIDSDGQLEVLAVRWPITDENPHAPRDLWLHENVAGVWTPVGQALELPGCLWIMRLAWADFDGDGHDDVAVLNHPNACDPFPVEYDPSWHSISIFFNEPMTHTLVPGPTVPVGGIPWEDLLMVEDFDGDGDLDFLVELLDPVSHRVSGVALVRGQGDGSFEEGVPIELPGILEWRLRGRGDLDGDGDLDWILDDAVVDDLFAAEPEIVHVHSEVIGVDGAPWANTRAFGDFNGDGVVDYIGGKKQASTGKTKMFAMISAP